MAFNDSASAEVLTAESARRTLEAACEQVGLDPKEAELLRIGSNAVYRLEKPVIVRIARDTTAHDSARRQVDVARWLAAAEYPATRVLDVDQPVEAMGRVVTFWESVSDNTTYAPIGQVAEVIRRLHELDVPDVVELPQKAPFDDIAGRMRYLEALDEHDAQLLRGRIEDLRRRYDQLEFVLPAGPIHGDANVGNVILDRTGAAVLIDLDSFAVGPREWDLVQTALFYERFGWHTEQEYRTFVDLYGWDIMTWPGYPVLADYREVAMTMWLAGKAADDEKAAAEVRLRVATMRDGGDRHTWAPY